MSPIEIHRLFGGQQRAGKAPQRNPDPLSFHPAPGFRAALGRIGTFAAVWFQYRRAHSWAYAARIAYGIAFRGLPF